MSTKLTNDGPERERETDRDLYESRPAPAGAASASAAIPLFNSPSSISSSYVMDVVALRNRNRILRCSSI